MYKYIAIVSLLSLAVTGFYIWFMRGVEVVAPVVVPVYPDTPEFIDIKG